jgi:AraC family transcriptional regulator
MALASQLLASGPGWRVEDVVCTSGPRDRPFEERHDAVCIAAVISGTFRYRSPAGSAVLAPGAFLLGSHHHCFECSHQHGIGDRCLSFRLTPEFWQGVAGAIAGVRALSFSVPSLPPSSRLLSLSAALEVAHGDGDAGAFEELALRLAGVAAGALNEGAGRGPAPSARDERRIGAALRHIEAHAEEPLSLAALAAVAAMSPYHFLRTFRALVGMTPHQFILHTRMNRAAVRLRQTPDAVSAIAFAAGFGDLSTFNRRFARIFGLSPSAYRMQSR